ncbi:hypothetical protein EWX78_08680 [Campylobacter coli]|uniref:Uncharacterized protein n=1 Tax=Campylobacter coli TaxID=195 RepID=A0A644SAV0_CAMCO|nr:hypothetical protein [Campylobacter coli]EAI3824167.1 hypothetical protein [Campylobacter coli]EAI5447037.1 hypothetical protein [Campylobacter coli]EAJ2630400.1 hypothetical protein [Campylobacter coli]EAJ9198309.1 hypothetical protein [Campylobacter coli]
MKNENNKSIRITFYVNNEKVISILEQLPKGVKGMFIEQAILEYSSRKPKIEFFFQGITKTKSAYKSKEQNKKSENSSEIEAQKIDKNNIQAHAREGEISHKNDKKSGGMMFNFKGKE